MTIANTMKPPMEHIKASQVLLQMITGYWATQVIYVGAKLGIADLLASGPKHYNELAKLTETHPSSLYRVLRALGSLGVFEESEVGVFQLTPLSNLLQTNHPQSLKAMAIINGEEHFQTWADLLNTVKTGNRTFEARYGKNWFNYLADHPESEQIFNQAMTNMNSNIQNVAIKAYDFSQFDTLMDVGGGHGSLLRSILRNHTKLKGILFDLPSVIAGAKEKQAAEDVANRLQFVEGSFFDTIPVESDACILSCVIHDWDDDKSITILKNCHQSIKDGGKLLLVEHIVTLQDPSPFTKLLDINMMTMTDGGKERTEEEYRQLFDAAGFQLTRIYPTEAFIFILEGVKK